MDDYEHQRIRKTLDKYHEEMEERIMSGCVSLPILCDIIAELERARQKHNSPWKTGGNIVELASIVAGEGGEALQAAIHYLYDRKGSLEDIESELIQTISTALRLLLHLKRGEK